jgi:alpha-L-arabinofuranosidase
MRDHNTFDQPEKVTIHDFRKFRIVADEVIVDPAAKSIIALEKRK